MGDFIVCKFNFVQFLLRPVLVIQNIPAAGAVFPPEPVDDIQPGFYFLQLVGRIGKIRPSVPKLFRHVLNLIH